MKKWFSFAWVSLPLVSWVYNSVGFLFGVNRALLLQQEGNFLFLLVKVDNQSVFGLSLVSNLGA